MEKGSSEYEYGLFSDKHTSTQKIEYNTHASSSIFKIPFLLFSYRNISISLWGILFRSPHLSWMMFWHQSSRRWKEKKFIQKQKKEKKTKEKKTPGYHCRRRRRQSVIQWIIVLSIFEYIFLSLVDVFFSFFLVLIWSWQNHQKRSEIKICLNETSTRKKKETQKKHTEGKTQGKVIYYSYIQKNGFIN